MATIDQFKANIAGGGARANQFRVILNTPSGIATGLTSATAQFMIRTASLPGQTIAEIPIQFRGRQLYLAGDREFETWTTTVINETDFGLRNGFEQWLSGINDLETSQGVNDVSAYSTDILVTQLDRDNNALKTYTFINCWPTAVAAIDLSFDTVSEVEQLEVTWRYTHFSASSV